MGVKDKAKQFWLFSYPHLPSLVTFSALITSFSAIYFSFNDQVSKAILCTLCGGFLDAMDGWLARKLNACSAFGAELDSLADLVSFGVSPAVVVYLTQIKDDAAYSGLGWGSACIYVCCMACRLARFNVTHSDTEKLPSWSKNFFKGVPAPAGAALLFAPIYIDLSGMFEICSAELYTFWFVFVAVMLISSVRTFSLKGVKAPGRNLKSMPVSVLIIFGCLTFLGFYMLGNPKKSLNARNFWKLAAALTCGYISTMPLSHMFYLNLCKSNIKAN